MKLVKGKIRLFPFHAERLFYTMEQLQMECPPHLSAAKLEQQIIQIAQANRHGDNARIRLTVFRGSGGLFDPEPPYPHVLIQSWEGPELRSFIQVNGIDLCVYPHAQKSCDRFASLKTSQFLPYAMAARWAKQHQCNDAIVLNVHNRVADTTIANLFILKNGQVITPPLSEGAVDGVMRRYLLQKLQANHYPVAEIPLTVADLQEAEEIFLTNVISGIRWVKLLDKNEYGGEWAARIYLQTIVPLWESSEKLGA
jgi:branched-chain amino acid aminotransferase